MNRKIFQMFQEKLGSFPISDYHGLRSRGLTCYLNSVLQVLFMTADFREEIHDVSASSNGSDAKVKRCSKDAAAIDAPLDLLFTALKEGEARTDSIIEQLGITKLYKQRDAAEYFENILRLTSPEASKIFRGELTHKTRCINCEQKNDSSSSFWVLPLVVKDLHHQTYSVEQGLEAFFMPSIVREHDVFCDHCSKKAAAEMDCEMTHTPEVLTLLLKRFRFSNSQRRFVKLHCKVDVPQTLRVTGSTYELYALVHHYGELTGGHYAAEIKSFETGEWYHFNDDVVQMIRRPGNSHMSSSTAYLLMYRKGGTRCDKSDSGHREDGAEVEAAGRREQRETRANGHCYYQMNNDLVERSRDPAKHKRSSGEVDKQKKVACQRPIKETLLPVDTRALRPRSASANTHTGDGHNEANRQQRDAHAEVHSFCPNACKSPHDTESHVRARRRSSSAGSRVSPVGREDRRDKNGQLDQRTDAEQLLCNGLASCSASLSPGRRNKSTAQHTPPNPWK